MAIDIVSASFNDNTIAWYENDGNADPSWTAADIASTAEGQRMSLQQTWMEMAIWISYQPL